MSDVTNLFKATVKTIKSRNKISKENGKKEMTNIFPATKQRSDFENTAKGLVSTITQLKDFLLKHRKDYVNAGSFLSSDVSSLTDTERDQIDTEAQTVIKKCQQTIVMFKKDAHHQIVHPQVKEHRDHVIRIIEDYLKVVCKVYSEQRAVRVKRVVDKKRISKLAPERKAKQRKINTKADLEEGDKSNSSIDAVPARPSNIDIDHTPPVKDESFSPEEAQMFEQENAELFNELNSLVSEVSQIEGKVLEIAKLQEIFAEKVLEQETDIESIEQTTVGTTENITKGNEEIREAIKNSAGFRVWILFFLITCTLSLLFLDWYNT
ncbi:syntaxin-18-like isoform X1 [Mytilus trossulus]|uniref:syntaxin-18-like isoform X1 n=1 Tax=Mytilus trossulus TaxID=6551 RepID=UPI003005638C